MNVEPKSMSREAVVQFLEELGGRGISMWVDGEAIIVKPVEAFTEAELRTLREVKPIARELILEAAAPPRGRVMAVNNPTRAPFCTTVGCRRRDRPMLRTVRKAPTWVCVGCYATVATATANEEGGAA
jgi:hypothetical protein